MNNHTFRATVLVRLNNLELGGTPLNALDLARTARELGVRSVLVADACSKPPSGPSVLEVAAAHGIDVLVNDERSMVGRTRRFSAIADQHGVDLVHTYGAGSTRQAHWGPCRFGKRPLVMTVYEMAVPPGLPQSGHLVVGTKYLLEEQSAERTHVSLISPPVDLAMDRPGAVPVSRFLSEHDLCPTHLRIVIVSRLAEAMKARGIGIAIRSMELLGRGDVDLVVVGDGDARAQLEEEAEGVNARLGRRAVTFTGAATEPRPAYECADIVIGMGSSAARGLAFGKPLVVAGENGRSQTFEAATSSLLFRNSFWNDDISADPTQELAAALRDLIERPERRSALGQFGRTFAVDNFGLEAMTEHLVSVYDRTLTAHARRRWFSDCGRDVVAAARALSRGRAHGG